MKDTGNDFCDHIKEPGMRDSYLRAILRHEEMTVCEYLSEEDRLLVYDNRLSGEREIPDYLKSLQEKSHVHPDDRWKIRDFLLGKIREEVEVRLQRHDTAHRVKIKVLPMDGVDLSRRLPLLIRDVTTEKHKEAILERRAQRDSLTMLYNQFFGRELINEYLNQKDPYATCGMMVVDLDYFKDANDTYGHLFGDHVLVKTASMFKTMFFKQDIVMRAGGDEFVIFLKDISHANLVKKAADLLSAVREMKFEGKDFSITCSVGVCFLTENILGYTYDQLFENADWALYRAKEKGRNCYVFCDNLQRFELVEQEKPGKGDIDARYLRNDIISTTFEIFEKTSSFAVAMKTLMEVIGYRLGLDRITVIRTDIRDQSTSRQFQWTSEMAPEVLKEERGFTKEDFLTLFQSYDEYHTTVLQYDNMGMYSPDGAALLMQGGAKTVLYAAMYCEGRYTGAISYVMCRKKQYWSRKNRKELGEVTKIISAHLSRSQAVNQRDLSARLWTEYDSLTGLLSFSRFHQEAERLIVGNYAESYMMVYTDFVSFKYFNHKYGYSAGDQLLKEFCNFLIEHLGHGTEVFFTRVVGDQFLMLAPCRNAENLAEEIDRMNRKFEGAQSELYQGARIRIRTGIYIIEENCVSASYAIDSANYARKQITAASGSSVRIYDEELKKQQKLESDIINGIDKAMREKQFQVYLQPKISLEDGRVVGAEALVRWRTEDGMLLLPDSFIPLCESSGRIEELDYYVFEQVVKFLAHSRERGRELIPVSVNASIAHASDPQAVQKYLDILNCYQVDPGYTEIELTETATVEEYEYARRWFQELRKAGIRTAMDDFGAGYSVLNTVIDIPVDTVKLDRGFLKNCTMDARGEFLLKKVVGIIQGLGYHVVCEGIETEEQSQLLREAGCEEGQGFLFSRPLTIEEYEELVY